MIQDTSLIAYRTQIQPTLGARQQLILDEIRKHTNITNCEISVHLHIPINTVTPRVNELCKRGLVFEDVKRKCQITGRTAIAWSVRKSTLF